MPRDIDFPQVYLPVSKKFFRKMFIPDSYWSHKLHLFKFRAMTISEVIALLLKTKLHVDSDFKMFIFALLIQPLHRQ